MPNLQHVMLLNRLTYRSNKSGCKADCILNSNPCQKCARVPRVRCYRNSLNTRFPVHTWQVGINLKLVQRGLSADCSLCWWLTDLLWNWRRLAVCCELLNIRLFETWLNRVHKPGCSKKSILFSHLVSAISENKRCRLIIYYFGRSEMCQC